MGANSVVLKDGLIRSLYQSDNVSERHGNRYEVDAQYVNALCENGFVLTGVSGAEGYPEAFEAKDHPFYAAVLYHPEFLSRPGSAHPLFVGFIQAAAK
jgi:CTP synthase